MMDLFDLLDREGERIHSSLKDGLVDGSCPERIRCGEAAVRRLASYLLALEQAFFPAVTALHPALLEQLQPVHRRLRRLTAEALLRYCGDAPGVQKALTGLRAHVRAHALHMRRSVYPDLYRSLSAAEASSVAHHLARLMSLPQAAETRRPLRNVPGWHRGRIDLSRIPTLLDVVPVPSIRSPGAG